ncbi:TonB-dependent receptor domain-containing protein [Methylocaldum szegediense]|uniref:FecR family protein n=1 Tax=Methylocaldum szegediense TaxID=73780 RepID=A0ABM9I412_9GAMM|nr:TonB-dependent receptor [Methylocaldum szegediense]CAI8875903.1 FecR family protein [Methylocaldum szegediense]
MQKSARLFLTVAVALVASRNGIAATCEQWAARLVSAQGQVEIQPSGKPSWTPVEAEQVFCPGDKIRTMIRSRASLLLPNQTYISLDQDTTVVFSKVKAEEPSWLELLTGALYARSRTPKPLDIRTPFINAAIKGTEFLIKAGPQGAQVTVFEGEVETSNAAGRIVLKDGQTAVAARDEAPHLALEMRPEDSVQWALYFPPLVDYTALQARTRDPDIAEGIRRYADGDVAGALAVLDKVPEASRDADFAALYAGLLLSVGRVDEAEPLLAMYMGEKTPAPIDALRSVIALARNQKSEALRLANAAVQTDPASASGWMAQSYARQADFDLEGALESIDHAARLDSNDALVQARRAELLAGLGRWSEARKAAENAVRINPRHPRAHVVLGFVELMDGDTSEALASFRKGTELDSADPLARFGTGMALVRRGELKEGTAAIETAASLDPSDALIRSYLGKAYYEQKRNAVAEKQFDLAKSFDPKDPTPWFYEAIKKQTENRPVEAFKELQRAIELNDNRAVYRSKLALDDDLAARSAALGRIYTDLGFGQRAVVEGWRSLSVEPGNYSAHRLLADTYSSLPRHEIARASEVLQSQLLQPINTTPIQPHLAEARLLIPDGAGPSRLSFNEFNPMFTRDRFSFQASGIAGSNDTFGEELVHSGLWDKFSYSLGQFHYETNGFRKNNDLRQDIYNVFAQGMVSPDLSIQAEYRHRHLEHGDLLFNGDLLKAFDDSFRREVTTDSVRAGLRYSPTVNSDLILSAMYLDTVRNLQQRPVLSPFIPPVDYSDIMDQRGFIGEAQFIYRRDRFDLILGAGRRDISADFSADFGFSRPRIAYDIRHTNAYLYSHIRFPGTMTWTLGVSYDSSHNQWYVDYNQLSPKLGLIWEFTPDTILRVAAFRTFDRGIEEDATIEPTQVAGFNQFFDGYAATDARRYGVGLDHKFSSNLMVGLEASLRDVMTPVVSEAKLDAESEISKQEEMLYRAYGYWAINDSFAASLEYQFDIFSIDKLTIYQNHLAPLSLSYFHPSGLSSTVTVTYVNQQAYEGKDESKKGHDDNQFALLDFSLKYRLPYRYGTAGFVVKNLLNQRFDFWGQNARGLRTGRLEETPLFIPERTMFFQLTLAF